MDKLSFIDRVTEKFKKNSWRLTAGTRNLIEILGESKFPLSIRDLCDFLAKQEHALDQATVYRLVEKLKSQDLVAEINHKFIACSEPKSPTERRHFLVSEKTGRAEEIFLDYHEAISKQLAKERGFLLRKTDLTFYGTFGDEM